MKRYILFAGDRYYARGGAHDIIDFFDTLEEALTAFQYHIDTNRDYDWFHIYDLQDRVIAHQSLDQAFH